MTEHSDERVFVLGARICDPNSSWNGKRTNLVISGGVIQDIGDHIIAPALAPDPNNREAGRQSVVEQTGLCVSPSFFDLCANSGEPGYERREDLHTLSRAAIKGGFGGLAIMPNTEPALQSKSEIELICNKSKVLPVEMVPVGAISRNREGLEMAELYDMWLSGARAFTDGDRPIQDSGLMMRALQYAADFGGLIMAASEDAFLAAEAKVHEGVESFKLGMKGIPSIAEELMISRDLMLARYTGTRIHFTALSSTGAVELIRRAKKEGVKVTCSVAAHQLVLDDSRLEFFDSNYKVKPPLRTGEDREALIAGVLDGTIDAICSLHTPQEAEFKHVEFETALYGIIGLETAYSLTNQALGDRTGQNQIIRLLAIAPREVLGLKVPSIHKGGDASLALYNPATTYTFTKAHLGSRSQNTPFLEHELKGRVCALYTGGKLFVQDPGALKLI